MKTSLLVTLTLFACLFSLGLFATTSPPPNPSQVPLDGGILIMLSAAAGYAANKLKKKDNKI